MTIPFRKAVLELQPDIQRRVIERRAVRKLLGAKSYIQALGGTLLGDLIMPYLPDLRSDEHPGAGLLDRIGRNATDHHGNLYFYDLRAEFAETVRLSGLQTPCRVFVKYINNRWSISPVTDQAWRDPQLVVSRRHPSTCVRVLQSGLEILRDRHNNYLLTNQSGNIRIISKCNLSINEYGKISRCYQGELEAELSDSTSEYAMIAIR